MSLKPEQIAHINIVNWFKHDFPEFADDFHHFANERFIDVRNYPGLWHHAKTLSKMGIIKGISDFFLAVPMNDKAGLWVELKVEEGKLSPEQITFIERKISRGYEALAVWGEEAAKAVILTYLNRGVEYGKPTSYCLKR
jgi:hypothetical protein